MTENGIVLPWMVIRQDTNGNRYRIGRYATRAEAQSMAERLVGSGSENGGGPTGGGSDQRYLVERLRRGNAEHS